MRWEDASALMVSIPDAHNVVMQAIYNGYWIDIQRMGGGKVQVYIAQGPASEYLRRVEDNISVVKLYLGFEHSPFMSVEEMTWLVYLDGRSL